MDEPTQGTALGKGFHKVRLAIRSKGQGRSGGARVITYAIIAARHVYLAADYDKSERSTLSDTELRELTKGFNIRWSSSDRVETLAKKHQRRDHLSAGAQEYMPYTFMMSFSFASSRASTFLL